MKNILSKVFLLGIVSVFGFSLLAPANAHASDATLGVDNIRTVRSSASADGVFEHGWKWIFDVTVPSDETVLKMKFGNWVNGAQSIPAGSNMRFYSSQSSNASTADSAIVISGSDTYSNVMNIIPTADRKIGEDGRQIQITIEVRVPVDSAGGSYSNSYDIQSTDGIPPVITLIGTPSIIKQLGSGAYIDLGATAFDNVDGDVTSLIKTTGTVDTSKVGSYILTYNAKDKSGNESSPMTRTVIVEDSVAPVITSPSTVTIEATGHRTTVDLGHLIVSDAGDPSPTITNNAQANFPSGFPLGENTVTWTATDASGNSSTIEQKVTVVDTTAPSITLNGEKEVSVQVYETYNDLGATAVDNYDGDLKPVPTSTVDTSKVGTYYVSYNVTDSNRQVASEVKRKVTVTPRSLTVTVDSHQKKTFGDLDPTSLTYSITSGSLFDSGTRHDVLTGDIVRETGEDAGSYVITQGTLSTSAGDNYKITFDSSAFTITPAHVAITLRDLNYAYDTTQKSATIDTDPTGIATHVTYNGSDTAPKNAGTYKVIVSTNDSNYSGNAEGSLVIEKAGVNVSAKGHEKTYNALTDAVVDLTVSDAIGDDILTATGDASFEDKTAGKDKKINVKNITLLGANASNYTSNTETVTSAPINQKTLTVSATADSREYNGLLSTTAHLSTDKLTDDKVTVSYTDASFDTKDKGGDKKVTVSGITIAGADADNYSLGNKNQTTLSTASIFVKKLTVNGVTADTRDYNGNNVATLTDTDAKLSGIVKIGDVTEDVTLDGTNKSAIFSDKNAGINKPVVVTGYALGGSDSGNYELTQPTGLTATINKLQISGFITTSSRKTYDGTASMEIVSRYLTGVVPNDDVQYIGGTAMFADKNVGANKQVNATHLKLSGIDADNYKVNDTADAFAEIEARPLTVTAIGHQKIYNSDSFAPETELVTNALPNDIVTVSGSAAFNDGKNVGIAKKVTVQNISLGGADAGNYTITYPNRTAKTTANIITKTLTIEGVAINEKTYDGLLGATLSDFGKRLSGLEEDDVVTLDGIATAKFIDKKAGINKPVNITGYEITGSAIGNYILTQPTLTGKINPKEIKGTLNVENKTYDGKDSATIIDSSRHLDGVIDGDTVAYAGGVAKFADKNVGDKTVNISGLALSGDDAENYTVNNTLATQAQINKADITVTALTNTKVYDGDATATTLPTITSGRLADGDTATFAETYDTANAGTDKVLTPKISINNGDGDANYNITYVDATGEITKATPVVSWNNPADAQDGTVLSDTQLNATASALGISVSGKFTYSPAAGTALSFSSGASQTLTVDFTPTDTTNYNSPPSKTVTINVLPPPPIVSRPNITVVSGGFATGNSLPKPVTLDDVGITG